MFFSELQIKLFFIDIFFISVTQNETSSRSERCFHHSRLLSFCSVSFFTVRETNVADEHIDRSLLSILVANPLSCFICDSKEDEHCPETWTRKDVLPVECGGPDGVQDARFCIKTIAVFGGMKRFPRNDPIAPTFSSFRCRGHKTFL